MFTSSAAGKTNKRQISCKKHPWLLPAPFKCDGFAASGLLHLQKKITFYYFNDDKEHGFTHHWSVHVPESSLLAVENLPLNFVSLLVHSRGKQESGAVLAELIPPRHGPV